LGKTLLTSEPVSVLLTQQNTQKATRQTNKNRRQKESYVQAKATQTLGGLFAGEVNR